MIILLIVLLLAPASAWAASASSTFDSTQNPLSESGAWAAVSGGGAMQKLNGVALPVAGAESAVVRTGTTFTADQEVSTVLEAIGGVGGPSCRGGAYMFTVTNTGERRLVKMTVFGFETRLLVVSGAVPVAGAKHTIRCVGTNPVVLTGLVNDVVVMTVNDTASPVTTGQPGFYAYSTRSYTSWTATTIAPPPSTTLVINYDEPTVSDCAGQPTPCSTVLNDLAKTTVWYKLGFGPDQKGPDVPALSTAGGQHKIVSVVVPTTTGDVTLWATATDTSGNQSKPSATVLKHLSAPGKGSVSVVKITQ